MLPHAPEALCLRTTRRLWPWPRPRRIGRAAAIYVLVCAISAAAAALGVITLFHDAQTRDDAAARPAAASMPRISP